MPNRPTRPGKHAARHKAPGALARTTERLGPRLQTLGLRRTGGTVVALGAVVVAGAAGNTTSARMTTDTTESSPHVALRKPSVTATEAMTAERSSRADRAAEASRSGARMSRTTSAELRRDHTRDDGIGGATGGRVARAQSVVPDDPRAVAQMMLADYGWSSSEFSCLDSLWVSESDWDVSATNPSSGAYGIPQSLPASKMASAGPDWRTNPATQIEWGLDYIRSSYGTPCSAWEFKQANNWY